MKLKNIICGVAVIAMLFSQQVFAAQEETESASAPQMMPPSESTAPQENVQEGAMPPSFEGRMPREGANGNPPPGGMRGDGSEMQTMPPDMQMPQGGRGHNFDAAMQNEMQQQSVKQEGFFEKNFTFLVSIAALAAGFLFVIFYKRKTF